MQGGWDFLWTVVASSAGTAALLAIAGGMFKAQISHWLNKDLETIKARHQDALEAKKTQLAKELETYRTSLIVQTEALKAAQDVRKSVALLVAQKRFEAIESLRNAYWSFGMNLETFLSMWDKLEQDQRYKKKSELEEGLSAIQYANKNAFPYLDEASTQVLVEFSNTASIALSRAVPSFEMNRVELGLTPFPDKIFELRVKADQAILKHWRAMLNMEDIHQQQD